MSEKPSKPVRRYSFKLRISYLSSAAISATAAFLYYVGAMPFPLLVAVLAVVLGSMGKIENG